MRIAATIMRTIKTTGPAGFGGVRAIAA